jgi:4-hydroxybutyrate CoA-transferase
MPSTANGGNISRICALLTAGATVTTPRTLADYIVTEYGVAELRGKNLRQRAKALIAICHPDFRERVERDTKERKDVNL